MSQRYFYLLALFAYITTQKFNGIFLFLSIVVTRQENIILFSTIFYSPSHNKTTIKTFFVLNFFEFFSNLLQEKLIILDKGGRAFYYLKSNISKIRNKKKFYPKNSIRRNSVAHISNFEVKNLINSLECSYCHKT